MLSKVDGPWCDQSFRCTYKILTFTERQAHDSLHVDGGTAPFRVVTSAQETQGREQRTVWWLTVQRELWEIIILMDLFSIKRKTHLNNCIQSSTCCKLGPGPGRRSRWLLVGRETVRVSTQGIRVCTPARGIKGVSWGGATPQLKQLFPVNNAISGSQCDRLFSPTQHN